MTERYVWQERILENHNLKPSNAVIVRAGKNSLHQQWLVGKPEFDLIVVNYETLPNELTVNASCVINIPGFKVAGWDEFFRRRPDVLQNYDQIALMDDDLACTAAEINMAFDVGFKNSLSLWQPTLTWDSYFSYAIFLKNPRYDIRFVNFIEMMCPFFSSEQLKKTLPLFSLGLETGIDRLWCRMNENSEYSYAVLDCVSVHHTRPVGKFRSAQGFVGENSEYQTVIDKMERDLGVYFRGPVAYAGVKNDGFIVKGRVSMAVNSLVTLSAWKISPNKGWFYRPILDHFRHILTRPIANESIKLGA